MFDDDEEPPESGVLPEIPDSTPEIPDVEPEIPDGTDAPRELKVAFWRLVVVFNLALLATSLGVMLVGFEGRFRDGGALAALGLAAFGYGVWRYRNRPRVE